MACARKSARTNLAILDGTIRSLEKEEDKDEGAYSDYDDEKDLGAQLQLYLGSGHSAVLLAGAATTAGATVVIYLKKRLRDAGTAHPDLHIVLRRRVLANNSSIAALGSRVGAPRLGSRVAHCEGAKRKIYRGKRVC